MKKTKENLLNEIKNKAGVLTYFEALTWDYHTVLRYYNNNIKEYKLI
jgi:hypothetical protein